MFKRLLPITVAFLLTSCGQSTNLFQELDSNAKYISRGADVILYAHKRNLVDVPFFNFGGTTVGTPVAEVPFIFHNKGDRSTSITSLSIHGTNAGDFVITSPLFDTTLDVDEQASFSISFTAGALGERIARLNVTLTNGEIISVDLSGTGHTNIYYVSIATGDDPPIGDGSKTRPFKNIHDGLGTAAPSDAVFVASGTYSYDANPVQLADGVAVYGGCNSSNWTRNISENATTLQDISSSGGTETDPVAPLVGNAGLGPSTIFDGFIILASDTTGCDFTSAILLTNSSPVISGNIISAGKTSTPGNKTYGIRANGGSPVIKGNTISGGLNTAPDTMGIYLNSTAGGTEVFSNILYGGRGNSSVASFFKNAQAQVYHNTIHGGSGSTSSSGVIIDGAGDIRITGNIILGSESSTAPISHAISSNSNGTVTIINNILIGGASCPNSTAINLTNSTAATTIYNNTMDGGYANNLSTAINLSNSSPVIQNNIIMASGGSTRIGINEKDGVSDPKVTHNTIVVDGILYHDDDFARNIDVSTIMKDTIDNTPAGNGIGTLMSMNNIYADPRFSPSENISYYLNDTTPHTITEGGIDLTGVAGFPVNDSGKEIDGTGAERTAPWSIGAHEHDGGYLFNTVYVSANNGSSSGNGTFQKPTNSIWLGTLLMAAGNIAGGTVKVAQGTYNESVQLFSKITLQGGYSDDFSIQNTKDRSVYPTYINGIGTTAVYASNVSNTSITGFTIKGASSATSDVHTVSALSSGFELSDCTIHAGDAGDISNPGASHAIHIAGGNVIIEDSIIHGGSSYNSSSAGVYADSGAVVKIYGNEIRSGSVHATAGAPGDFPIAGIIIKTGNPGTLFGNSIYTGNYYGSQTSTSIDIAGIFTNQPAAGKVDKINNIIISRGHNDGTKDVDAIYSGANDTGVIYNNTIIAESDGNWVTGLHVFENIEIDNNLISISGGSNRIGIWSDIAPTSIDNNLFSGCTTARHRQGAVNDTGIIAGQIQGGPLPAGNDNMETVIIISGFTPIATSPAGQLSTVLQGGKDLSGVIFFPEDALTNKIDYMGNIRTIPWSIGAIEVD